MPFEPIGFFGKQGIVIPCFRLTNIITHLFKKSYRFSKKNTVYFYVILHKNYEETENFQKPLAIRCNICDNIISMHMRTSAISGWRDCAY